MTEAFILAKVEVFSGYREDSPTTPRWYINHHYTDGAQCIVHDTLSHIEALREAVISASEDGGCVPIVDNSAFR